MELNVIGAKPLSVSDDVFGKEYRQDLVHQVVTAYRNAGRAGTKAQLSRAEVSGTTKKFKKQKGGGARHGDYRAPIFVGGGVAFAAKPRDFSQKVNKKMFRGAMASILSELIRQDRVKVVADFDVDAPKTKSLIAKLGELKADGKTIIVSETVSENLYLAARNNHKVLEVIDTNALNPVALVRADHVVITVDAVKKIEEWLA
ncbi:50S ribosomal protein L4 [Tahibacter soli]|jgi:large subunit ribosomal protein L4|uniref:Large ribosomal subunit protein uL4 n=1 Tax=Tahibacter soli TaxID=2983605 RepID=A0A9X3YHZ5_9GAMM|nr:50S ribosomal protein L4 [Tahibacter soli]MDC8011530.1 50S ribosomal protein L4 [Tahibacter soli]